MASEKDILSRCPTRKGENQMKKDIETMLIECHILMDEAIKGYEDRLLQSEKLFEIRQYRNKLPKDMYEKIDKFVNENIYPMLYDAEYWSFIERDERYGSYDDKNHFIIDSDSSLKCIIFSKYHHAYDLCVKLSEFMLQEFNLDYNC